MDAVPERAEDATISHASPGAALPPRPALLASPHDLPAYLPSGPLRTSEDRGWVGILARSYGQGPQAEALGLPGTPDHELLLHLAGPARMGVSLNGGPWRTIRSEPGELYLVPRRSPHEWRWDAPIEYLEVHIEDSFLRRVARGAFDAEPDGIDLAREGPAGDDAMVEQVGRALHAELVSPGPLGWPYAESLAHTLGLHLLRRFAGLPEPASRPGGLSPARLRRVEEYARGNLGGQITVGDLANVAATSRFHFGRLFKRATGETPLGYVTRLRMEEARRLLLKTDLSVLQVCLAVGYENPSHFARLFRRTYGVVPTVLRKDGAGI